MACLRRTSTEGRGGAIQCDEEGCEYGFVKTPGYTGPVKHSPTADCVLQLRLRAGDAEEDAEWRAVHDRLWRDFGNPADDERFVIGNDGADDSRRDERRYLEQSRRETCRHWVLEPTGTIWVMRCVSCNERFEEPPFGRLADDYHYNVKYNTWEYRSPKRRS